MSRRTPDSTRIAPGRVLAGRYRIERHVASGGMADVWCASDELLGRNVAVKVIAAHLADDDAFMQRFDREALAAAKLSHPNIVQVYDLGDDDGVRFIVSE